MKKLILSIILFLFLIVLPFLTWFLIGLIPENILSAIPKIIVYLFADILIFFVLCFIYRKSIKKEFLIFKSDWKKYLEDNIQYWVIGLILMSLFNLIISNIISKEIPENEQLIRLMFKDMPIYVFLSVLLFAPFTEELIYRKSLRNVFKNDKIFIVFSGILFGLAHVVYSYKELWDFLYIIPYGALGSSFAYMYIRTKTIFVPICFHFIHNFLSIVMTLIVSLL